MFRELVVEYNCPVEIPSEAISQSFGSLFLYRKNKPQAVLEGSKMLGL